MTSLLVHETEWCGPETVAFESRPTPDQWLALASRGRHEVESFADGVWRHGVMLPGCGGLTPGGKSDRLRVRACAPDPIGLVHVYIPQHTLTEVADAFRRAGAPCRTEPLDALAFTDPAIANAVFGLVDAMRAGAPDLYAEAAAQYLATHLVAPHSRWSDRSGGARAPRVLPDYRLARVVEYMGAHFREPLTLERLAAEAAVSKFHFVRLFKAATGETPHARLTRVRMDAARQLLRETELAVAEVARASGYTNAAQFAALFARCTGCTPRAFRRAARSGAAPADGPVTLRAGRARLSGRGRSAAPRRH